VHFHGNVEQLLAPHVEDAGRQESLMYERDRRATAKLDVSEIPTGETIVYSFRDATQTVRHDRLIAFRRSKSNQMLKSISRPSLVARVQAGEKNISFAVASVVFVDVVLVSSGAGPRRQIR
jgi:hypothetical protein